MARSGTHAGARLDECAGGKPVSDSSQIRGPVLWFWIDRVCVLEKATPSSVDTACCIFAVDFVHANKIVSWARRRTADVPTVHLKRSYQRQEKRDLVENVSDWFIFCFFISFAPIGAPL